MRREQAIHFLGALPNRVTEVITGLSSDQLGYRHGPAFSTMTEVIAHLRSEADSTDAAIRRICSEDAPEIDWEIPVVAPTESIEIKVLVDDIGRFRRRTVDLLRNLDRSYWERTATVNGQGQLTLIELCSRIAVHGLGHVSQLRNLAALVPRSDPLASGHPAGEPQPNGQRPVDPTEIA